MAQDVKKNSKAQSKTPLVSVVMSVYNGEKYLREAIESILNQTLVDFEFIIINDGSSDDTLKIIKSYSDPRIVLISRKNKGLVVSLNEGIQKSRGKYIARMDADDVSMAKRLERQVRFLELNPKAVLCGTSFIEIDEVGNRIQDIDVPTTNDLICQELTARCTFAHGSTLFLRSSAISAGLYRAKDYPAEDYALWLRLSRLGEVGNLSNKLFQYRIVSQSISRTNNAEQIKKAKSVQEKARSIYPFLLWRQPIIWAKLSNEKRGRLYINHHYAIMIDAFSRSDRKLRYVKIKLAFLLWRLWNRMFNEK